MKPLYAVPKAGNCWFANYHPCHKDKLVMKESIYDPYLFYNSSSFGILGMQIDDTCILVDNNFAKKEEVVIQTAKIITKDLEHFTFSHLLKFHEV